MQHARLLSVLLGVAAVGATAVSALRWDHAARPAELGPNDAVGAAGVAGQTLALPPLRVAADEANRREVVAAPAVRRRASERRTTSTGPESSALADFDDDIGIGCFGDDELDELAFRGHEDEPPRPWKRGHRYEARFDAERDQRDDGRAGTRGALRAGLAWLKAHQDADGRWDSDDFMKHDPPGDRCAGAGGPEHDVGVTGLALLAFLGDGHGTRQGEHKALVSRGIKWLKEQQDPESGLLGEKVGHSYMYDHGIASLALAEAYGLSKSPLLKGNAQQAIRFITTSRNPYGAWRYDSPPVGDNDTSVTGWMVLALQTGQSAGLRVDSDAFPDTLAWFDEVTDPLTGRTGYDSTGYDSSRVPGVNDHYPTNTTESMTAVALLCRSFLGQTPDDTAAMRQGGALLRASLPEHGASGLRNDMYYWYYGSYAMYQLGGDHWDAWNAAMKLAVVGSQRRDGSRAGSWDPDGPWGFAGGRVYSTALGTLCLEVYDRFPRWSEVR